MYGPLIFEPLQREPYAYEHDYVVILSDWTDADPLGIVSNLNQQSEYFNFHRRTVGTFFADVRQQGMTATLADRFMWGAMRMEPTDIMDITGATYTFLVNGRDPAENWTSLYWPSERVSRWLRRTGLPRQATGWTATAATSSRVHSCAPSTQAQALRPSGRAFFT